MPLLEAIQAEIKRLTKNGDKPNIIWLGKEERRELEDLIASTPTVRTKGVGDRDLICGLPVEFVSSNNWFSISTFFK